jgi:hypothetical protein
MNTIKNDNFIPGLSLRGAWLNFYTSFDHEHISQVKDVPYHVHRLNEINRI